MSGILRYVEKGETLSIRHQDFFVNDCQPRNGIVDEDTSLEIEVGFTETVFREKQVLAD